jgi:hypothetical protein
MQQCVLLQCSVVCCCSSGMQLGCEHGGARGVRVLAFVGCVALLFVGATIGHTVDLVCCWVVQSGWFQVKLITDLAQRLGSAVLAITFALIQ